MRKLHLLRATSTIFLAAVIANGLFADSLAPVPRPAPEFVIQQTGGKQILLSSFKGKNVVLAFMYATCSHCQHTAGLLNDMQKEYAGKDVQFLGATFNEGDMMRIDAFIKTFHITFPCGYSNIPSVITFLQWPQDQPYSVPMLVFIDKHGVIRKQVVGDEKFLSEKDQPANIRAEIDKLLKTPSGPVTSSKAKKAPKS